MTRTFSTSPGNPQAARRADYAEMLFGSGEPTAAAEVLTGALAAAPGWSAGWFRLGEFHEAAGCKSAAIDAWRRALELDPADHVGAALKLSLATGSGGRSMPPAFVEALFDRYAPSFEASLTGKLGYRAPEVLERAIREEAGTRFARAADLGCGTGLMGERLRPLVDRLEGFDLSRGMLREASAKRVYDRLLHADVTTLALPPASVDLAVAADVFNYVGDLDQVLARTADALTEGGLLAFSVEKHSAEGFALRETRRYVHSRPYLEIALQRHRFIVVSMFEDMIRRDHGEQVQGLYVVARVGKMPSEL